MWNQQSIANSNPAIARFAIGHRQFRVVDEAYTSPMAPREIREKMLTRTMERLRGKRFTVDELVSGMWHPVQHFKIKQEAISFIDRQTCL